jgi:copper resistance protein D
VILAGLAAARFVHYSALMLLFGCGAFPIYAGRPNETLSMHLRRIVLIAAIVALASGVIWFGFTTAGMSGHLAGATDPAVLWLVAQSTTFGQIWIVRLLLVAGALILFARKGAGPGWMPVLLSALAVAAIAWTGHGQNGAVAGALLHPLSDALHLLAAAIWIGALAWLLLLLSPYTQTPRSEIEQALAGFSGVGPAVVACLLITGIVNSLFLIGPQNALSLWRTAYGLALIFKLALFAAMFALATVNRFRLTPRLAMAAEGVAVGEALQAFKGTIAAETALAALVLAAVALMGALPPPTD